MDAFERLSPALQYQIVNGLGWTSLRPVQEQAIDAVLDGYNCVVLAPTAGGKTEAALFPLLSIMDSEDLPATSVLYVAPIRALLNNQEPRLERLSDLVGRRAFKWHGDVGAAARRRFVREPADILATTPESLEAMLMSTRVPARRLLARVQAVIVDEVHAFAADDRGAHLAAVLERITRISEYDIQRIGLSATVGDPEAICEWLSGSSARPRRVVDPGGRGPEPVLSLDYVGGLSNAALMVDRLKPGTRRLVFVDSRRRVEELGDHLQQLGVDVFVSHSSLAASERHAAERAFEEGTNCVIVATSAMELGIDVGDLDHVLQVDSPATVSSFLQRMGRTGRRPGTRPNYTFLATSEEAVLQAAGLLRLHQAGYVEPVAPSRRASHILAHQLIALGLQQTGLPRVDWWAWLEGCFAFSQISGGERKALLGHMLSADILADVDGRLVLGHRGEKLYAGRNFMELYAVFSVPRVLKVMHGSYEIGTVDAWFAQQYDARPFRFVLAGRAWEVLTIHWRAGACLVQPAEAGTYPRWMGQPVLLSYAVCQSMREVLVDDSMYAPWSKRARDVITQLREEYVFLRESAAPLVSGDGGVKWWTFAGGRANSLLAVLLRERLDGRVAANNLCVTFSDLAAGSTGEISVAIAALAEPGVVSWQTARQYTSTSGRRRISKFQPCLPKDLELDLLARSLCDVDASQTIVTEFLASPPP